MSGFKRLLRATLIGIALWVQPWPAAANPFLGSDAAPAPAAVAAPAGAPVFIQTQLTLRNRIAQALRNLKEQNSPGAFGFLLAGAFLYGILHAAGPGHRKTVLFSLFLTRKTQVWEPLAAGFLSAAVHAGTALALVGVLSAAAGATASLSTVDSSAMRMESYSLLILAALALALLVLKGRSMLLKRGHSEHPANLPGKGRFYAVIASSSLVPCPGAIMLVMLAMYLDLTLLGIVAVVAMSAGMGVVISAAAYLAWFGREKIFNRLKARALSIQLLADTLELGSYAFIVFLSLYSVWPFLVSLVA